jgi:predicted dehydrogenase
MGTPVKVCVVGLGRVARSHLAGMREVPEAVEITGVVSSDQEKRKAVAAEFSVPRTYATLSDALQDPEIEAVDLCIPNHVHLKATVQSAEAGKHILVEKPMANTVRDCRRMIGAADKAGVTLMVGQSRRFYDAVFKSKDLLDQGKIGSLISITALLFAYLEHPPTQWWRSKEKAGGLMIPLWGNHIIDYVLWMFAENPKHVFCEALRNNRQWEGEDEVTILIGFAGNRYATIKMSWNTRLRETGEWDGKGKMLSSADIIYERYVQGASGTLHLNDETELSLNGASVLKGPQLPGNFALQYREFAQAIREKREPLTSGRKALEIIRVQEAALRSSARHQVVRL